MPANPHQCRLYASRFFALAKNARSLVADFADSDDRSAEWWDRLRRSA